MQEIEAFGAVVCGVSVDNSDRLERFGTKYRLPFVLLSDRGGAVARRYGSLINLGLLKFARYTAKAWQKLLRDPLLLRWTSTRSKPV